MANEFIIRKGYKSLAASEVTGSLKTTGNIVGAASGYLQRLYIQDKKALDSSSNFLYIDPNTEFGSGIYINNAVRIDGGLLGSYNEDLQLRTGTTTRVTIANADGAVRFHNYGAGYLKTDSSGNITVDTSTIEDTLDSVTDRGATTTNSITTGDITIQDATPVLVLKDSNNGAGGSAHARILFSNTGGKAIAIGTTGDDDTSTDLYISSNASSTYGGYLLLDSAGITDTQADIIIDPKTDFKVFTAGTQALDIDTSQNATFAGNVTVSGSNTIKSSNPTLLLVQEGVVNQANSGRIVFAESTGNTVGHMIIRYDGSDDKIHFDSGIDGTSDLFTFARSGDATVSGDLTVAGTLTAQEFHTEFVSASIIYESGSTKFGDTSDDIHNFTGSLNILSGSATIKGPGAGLTIHNSTNGGGSLIRFTDQSTGTQIGDMTFFHSDGSSQGGGASWHFVSEPDTVLIVGSSSVNGRFVAKSAGSTGEVDYGFYDDVNTGMVRTSADNVSLVAGGVRGVGVGATAVSLKYAGNTKLATSNTGVSITGDIDADDITIDDWGSVSASLSAIQTAGGVNGSGAADRIAIWSDSDTLTSNSALTFTGGHILVNQGTEYRSKDTGGSVRTLMRVNSSNELEYGWSANGPVKFMGGGSYAERMRIHTNGKVGIGTTSPDTHLHVYQASGTTQVKITSVTDNALLYLDSNRDGAGGEESGIILQDNGTAKWEIFKTSGNDYGIYDYTRSGMSFRIVDNGDMRLMESGGSVGIGTTSPQNKLHIYSGSLRLENGATSVTQLIPGGSGNSTLTVKGGNYIHNVYFDTSWNDFRYARLSSSYNTSDSSFYLYKSDSSGGTDATTTISTGTSTFAGNVSVLGADVTITANIIHAGDSDTYFGFHGNNLWRVVTGGTERIEVRDSEIVINDGGSNYDFRVESDSDSNNLFSDGGNNRIGIGTNSPAGKLHINTGTGTGNANTVIIDRPASSDYSGVSFATAGTVDWSIGHNSANNLEIFEDGLNSKTRVTVETGGNVGIGSDNPSELLHLYKTGNNAPLLVHTDDHSGIKIKGGNSHDRYISFQQANGSVGSKIGWDHSAQVLKLNGIDSFASTHLVVDVNGKVGIGTDSPSNKLDVMGAISGSTYYGDGSNLTGITAGGTDDLDDVVERGSVTDNNITINGLRTNTDSTHDIGTNGVRFLNGYFDNLHTKDKIQNNTAAYINYISNQGHRFYIDGNNDDTSHKFQILANTTSYAAGNVIFTMEQTGATRFDGTGNVVVSGSGDRNLQVGSSGGNAGLYLDGSNGDFAGSDYFSLRQMNDKSVEFNARTNTGNTLFYSKGALNLTQNGADSTFAGRVIIGNDAITTDKPGLVVGDTTNNGQITIRGGQPTLFFDKSGTNDAVILTDGVSLKFKNGTLDSEGSDQLTLDTSGNATFEGSISMNQSNTQADITGNSSGNLTIDNNTGTIAFQANGSTVNSVVISSSEVFLNEDVRIGSFGNNNAELAFGQTIANKVYNYGAEIQTQNSSIQLVLGRNNGTSVQGTGGIGADQNNAFAVWNTTSTTQIFEVAHNGNTDISGNLNVDGTGTSTIDGNLTVAGTLTAQEFHTEFVSSSILFESGSTVFGNSADDVHTFTGSLNLDGTLTATVKSFDIVHPTQEGKRLIYGVLEGPEHAVYVRGESKADTVILPEEWVGLVDETSITAQFTPIGKPDIYYYEGYENNTVKVGGPEEKNYFYYIQATRKDVEPLITVQ